jgi:D-3-phosphoglycerate dehydrogenase
MIFIHISRPISEEMFNKQTRSIGFVDYGSDQIQSFYCNIQTNRIQSPCLDMTQSAFLNLAVQGSTMEKFRIKTYNRIAPEGLSHFDDRYIVGSDVKDPHGIIVRSAKINTEDFPYLVTVARAGSGVDNITVDKANMQGICIFNTPGANANAVAELVFVMAGIGARNIYSAIDFCRELTSYPDNEISKHVEEKKSTFRGFELAGKRLGVIGLGQVGVRVANGGARRQMKTIGFDPSPALENIHLLSSEVKIARSLREVLHHAEILSLHIPSNDKTRGFANRDLLDQLPEGAMLINFCRKEVVDEEAVLSALSTGRLSRYVTDFPTSATLKSPNVIASPHLGASTEESEEHSAAMAARAVKAYLEHGTTTHSVNFPTAESIPADKVHTRLIMINQDTPGMIGFASQTIGSQKINIASYINESNGDIGYNIIDLEKAIPDDAAGRIKAHPEVIRTRLIRYKE